MGREDQKEEREVLESIFPDEITDISETEYRVSITLDLENESGDETPPPTFLLRVSYPEDYPDVGPDLDILPAPNTPKHPHLDLAEDKPALLSALEPTVEENLGMAMIFTLVSALKEAAEQIIIDRRNAATEARDAEARKAEEAENAKFMGERVTRERFLAWREEFYKEMAEKERKEAEEKMIEDAKKRRGSGDKKLTGRQLWERGLAGKGEDEEDEDIVEGVKGVKIGA
ncbi:ubiquitin-conjugating enzyme/RWD-like protein [Phyllosticta citribraziliensis]|uniref:Ubiquitin-conjugating enzyme/RWD-like protein n=1 Tax=Phyllosticta citribraziliensis TaxID=989973 RepID=A0ABR1LSA7_9PEZI